MFDFVTRRALESGGALLLVASNFHGQLQLPVADDDGDGGCLNVNALRDRIWYPTLAKATLSRRTMYQTRHTFASNALAAGEAPSWVAAMLGHASPEMLFSVYARFIPNRTRRDGSALVSRMDGAEKRLDARQEG